jgi:hypothetical protein
MTVYPMAVRCGFAMEVQMVGQKFQTMKDCPEGISKGTEPGKLMEACVKCERISARKKK